VADAYWAHYDSWEPTGGVATDLGIDLQLAKGLAAQAKTLGVLESRRPSRWR